MTIVGRSQIDHPALGAAGGSALHASIESIYTNIGNDLAARYDTAASIANSAVTTFTHNFGVQFADLKVLLYTGTHPNLVRVSDPVASGWVIAANGGNLKTQIDVTAPSSGGPHTFAVITMQSRGAEKLADLDDINTTLPIDGQFLIYDTATSKWVPSYLKYKSETATISSNTLTPATGTNIQRITTGAADLQMIASPTAGKVYVLINDTGTDFLLKNDTGGTAANRIYTGIASDITLKSQASITLVYNSGVSRWVVSGGAGGGGLVPSTKTANFAASAGNNYLVNTSGGAIAATLPAGTTGATMRFVDSNETWGTNNLTLTPASGEIIDMLAANEALTCDVTRGWVELSWDGTRWAFSSLASTTVGEASASAPGIVSTGTQSFAGNKTFVGTITPSAGIVGKTDGIAATTGNVGQVIESVSGLINHTGNGQYTDITNIPLTSGLWMISAAAYAGLNTATAFTVWYLAIGTASGNTAGGASQGSTQFDQVAPTAANNTTISIPSFIVNITASTTYYLKFLCSYSGGTPQAKGRITAVRLAI